MITRRDALRALGACAVLPATVARAAEPMPVAYVAHGGPQLAVDRTRGAALAKWAASIPKPSAIVVFTPHYRARGFEIGRVGRGHALYSFPSRMRSTLPPDLEFATPPNDAAVARVRALLGARGAVGEGGRPGFDHTSWMPLRHMFPNADVPVVEIAMPFANERALFDMGRALAPLRREGFLVVASGNLTHNLATVFGDAHDEVAPWAEEFDAWVAKALSGGDVAALLDWRRAAPKADLAHPDDGGHFRALLVALGAALEGDRVGRVRFFEEGFELGSSSKRGIELA